jgi:hypothetical protein
MGRENGKRNRCRHCNVRLRGPRTDARRIADDETERHPLPLCALVSGWHLFNRRVIGMDDPPRMGRLPRGARIRKPSEYGSVIEDFHDHWRKQMGARLDQSVAARCGAKVARLRYAA